MGGRGAEGGRGVIPTTLHVSPTVPRLLSPSPSPLEAPPPPPLPPSIIDDILPWVVVAPAATSISLTVDPCPLPPRPTPGGGARSRGDLPAASMAFTSQTRPFIPPPTLSLPSNLLLFTLLVLDDATSSASTVASHLPATAMCSDVCPATLVRAFASAPNSNSVTTTGALYTGSPHSRQGERLESLVVICRISTSHHTRDRYDSRTVIATYCSIFFFFNLTRVGYKT